MAKGVQNLQLDSVDVSDLGGAERIFDELETRDETPAQIILAGQDFGAERSAQELEAIIDSELGWANQARGESEWRFAVLARALAEYEDWERWRETWSSMNAFLEAKAAQFGVKRSSIYGALWVGLRLAPHLTEAEMREFGKSKLYVLASATRDDGLPPPAFLVEKAKTLNVDSLKALVKKPLLEGETDADLELIKLGPYFIRKADKPLIDECFAWVKEHAALEDSGEALIVIFQAAQAEFQHQSSSVEATGNAA